MARLWMDVSPSVSRAVGVEDFVTFVPFAVKRKNIDAIRNLRNFSCFFREIGADRKNGCNFRGEKMTVTHLIE